MEIFVWLLEYGLIIDRQYIFLWQSLQMSANTQNTCPSEASMDWKPITRTVPGLGIEPRLSGAQCQGRAFGHLLPTFVMMRPMLSSVSRNLLISFYLEQRVYFVEVQVSVQCMNFLEHYFSGISPILLRKNLKNKQTKKQRIGCKKAPFYGSLRSVKRVPFISVDDLVYTAVFYEYKIKFMHARNNSKNEWRDKCNKITQVPFC